MVKVLGRKSLTLEEYRALCTPDISSQQDVAEEDKEEFAKYQSMYSDDKGQNFLGLGFMAQGRGVLRRDLFPELYKAYDELAKEHGLEKSPLLCLRPRDDIFALSSPFFLSPLKKTQTVFVSYGFLDRYGLIPSKNENGVFEVNSEKVTEEALGILSHELVHSKHSDKEVSTRILSYATAFAIPVVGLTLLNIGKKGINLFSHLKTLAIGVMSAISFGGIASNLISRSYENRSDEQGIDKIEEPIAFSQVFDRSMQIKQEKSVNQGWLSNILDKIFGFTDDIGITSAHLPSQKRIERIEQLSGKKLEDYKKNNSDALVDSNFTVELVAVRTENILSREKNVPNDVVIEPTEASLGNFVSKYFDKISDEAKRAFGEYKAAVENQRAMRKQQSNAATSVV